MAALSITAANVLAGSDARIYTVTAGGTITAGMVLYRDASDGKYKAADGAASATAACDGIALNAATNGQPLNIVKPEEGGTITIGATVTVGQFYGIADTDANAGEIVPISDYAAGDYPVIIGVATTTAILLMKLIDPNVARA
jgi:hypothetical protein